MKEQLIQVKEYPVGTVTVISEQWKAGTGDPLLEFSWGFHDKSQPT